MKLALYIILVITLFLNLLVYADTQTNIHAIQTTQESVRAKIIELTDKLSSEQNKPPKWIVDSQRIEELVRENERMEMENAGMKAEIEAFGWMKEGKK